MVFFNFCIKDNHIVEFEDKRCGELEEKRWHELQNVNRNAKSLYRKIDHSCLVQYLSLKRKYNLSTKYGIGLK